MASPKVLATTDEQLPEDIIVQILYRLPVKPLVRFKCVSKRWSSIVSDPQFAKSHFKFPSERKTLSHKLLLSTRSQFESLDFQLPSFPEDASVRKLTFPFEEPGRDPLQILGSCNGMVFVAADLPSHDNSYIWNPTTGLLFKLPNPFFDSIGVRSSPLLPRCGFGYVSATDDYKVFVARRFWNSIVPVEMYSSKANSWKRIESQPYFSSDEYFTQHQGTFSKEALHWLVFPDPEDKPTIIAFDLVKEKFREMPLPFLIEDDETNDFCSEMGVVSGGCLCVASYVGDVSYSETIQLWVMMDYDVCESWTKLVKLPSYDQLRPPFFYCERSIVMFSWGIKHGKALVKFDHKEEEKLDKVAVCSGRFRLEVGFVDMIEYHESLLWLHDYQRPEGRRRRNEEECIRVLPGL